jgi:hypothetical protein
MLPQELWGTSSLGMSGFDSKKLLEIIGHGMLPYPDLRGAFAWNACFDL